VATDPRLTESNDTMPFSGSGRSFGSHSFPIKCREREREKEREKEER
jgi:hypothetical protein